MGKKYHVDLTSAERDLLLEMTSRNKVNRAKLINAFVLLKADRGGDGWKDEDISAAYNRPLSKLILGRRKYRFFE